MQGHSPPKNRFVLRNNAMTKRKSHNFLPLYISLGIIVGIIVGSFYTGLYSGKNLSIINASGNKLSDLLYIIDDQYVDTVKIDEIVEKALPQILKELDPHSTYINVKDVELSMQDLRGSFSGIGVQFIAYKDTVRVVHVIKGGPSEYAGLQAGDRIVRVDGESFVGEQTKDNENTMKRLKGERGSEVSLGIIRLGETEELNFTLVRGDVPVNTVSCSYMINDSTGYISISSFGETTYPEFLAALAKLNQYNFEHLIIDLRGNLGGYMAPAVQIANEFLSDNRLIVYTEGRKSPREDFASDGMGAYQSMPLVLLLDESSASASEILAGAIQDNDRGTIVGRRSFGKGLVQVPIDFTDGSMLRLTKARYYTPSGRCLQKPYVPGKEEDYEQELIQRAQHGEYFHQDSIKITGQEFTTRHGRKVYGGGGIIPDVFIPRDTLGITPYFREVYLSGMMRMFAYEYVDAHRSRLNECTSLDDMLNYLKRKNLVENFVTYASGQGVKRRNIMIKESYNLLWQFLSNYVVDDILGTEASVTYANRYDPFTQKALDIVHRGETFPQIPVNQP